ncbi:retrovirus-related Pol polyprotein LINE-1 [Elysia marginata]|uniref:Retrovirus-related Pol polyprotein LINE-1 n=1 Tax=Elysia marginata TaxID=1093978 RepID=A0AAV4IAB8_9GAST|nr:retrovirus-related Pol polyprotein LINE-1 [Elysia marginata]
MRVGTWNVGTMTGKGRELVEVCKRRSLDILCVQETKCGGNSSRQLGHRYRIIYSGESNNRNGVGIILSPHLSEQVVQVDRQSDKLMKVKMISGGGMINIISAYAPQVGEKEELTKDLECMIDTMPVGEKVIIGADLNAHLGEGGEGYRRIHSREGYGKRNAEGQKALESLEGLDMAVVNTFFKKREKLKITYKSGQGQSQRDFIMTRREDLKMFSDCKVIAGEEVVHQQRLVCGVVKVKECKKKRTSGKKDSNMETNRRYLKGVLLSTAEEVCGTSKGGKKIDKETWWWSEEVQTSIKKKKEAFKNWQRGGTDQLKEVYKEKKKEAKRTVAKAKEEGYKEWYENLDTREGEKTIYRIAKQRAEAKRDIKEIKDQQGEVLTGGEKIKERWRKYYTTLLNKENQRDELEDIPPVEGPTEELTRKEIIDAIKAMKKGKAAGCSGVSADMIKVLEESGVDIMVDIIGTVWEEEEMPEDWKQSAIVPIYKQKGDPLDCGN